MKFIKMFSCIAISGFTLMSMEGKVDKKWIVEKYEKYSGEKVTCWKRTDNDLFKICFHSSYELRGSNHPSYFEISKEYEENTIWGRVYDILSYCQEKEHFRFEIRPDHPKKEQLLNILESLGFTIGFNRWFYPKNDNIELLVPALNFFINSLDFPSDIIEKFLKEAGIKTGG